MCWALSWSEGVLTACPELGFSQDEDGEAARRHVQGLRQEVLPQVPAPHIEQQVPNGVAVPRRALNSGTATGRSVPAPSQDPQELACLR